MEKQRKNWLYHKKSTGYIFVYTDQKIETLEYFKFMLHISFYSFIKSLIVYNFTIGSQQKLGFILNMFVQMLHF